MMARSGALARARRYAGDQSGLAAFEIVVWLGVLFPALLSIIDLGTYTYLRMQVENAAQVGAQAAWSNCANPPISNCPTMTAAVDNSIGSTTLGSSVTRTGGFAEQYYCVDIDTKALVGNGSSTSCSGGRSAGYYVQVSTTYSFNPLFPGASVASLLPANITQTAWARLR